MAKMNLNNCNSLSDFAKYNKDTPVTHSKMHLKSKISGVSLQRSIIVNTTSITNKYFDFILENVTDFAFSDSDFLKYRYQPKRFCLDTYGTVELWSLLLKINNMTSIVEFNQKKIKVFNSRIFELLGEILIMEHENMITNSDVIYHS